MKPSADSVISFLKAHYVSLLMIIVLLAWSLFTFNKTAPITEGSSVYSDMIISGKMAYRDFELVLPPLQLYLITGFFYIFGGNLLPFRILGIVVMITIALIFYKTLNFAFEKKISACSTLVAIFIFLAGSASTFSEYHAFTLLFAIASCYYAVKILSESYNGGIVHWYDYFLVGLLTACVGLIRHPTGLLLFGFYIIVFVVAHFIQEIRTKILKPLLLFVAGVLIPLGIVFLWLVANNALDPFYHMVLHAETKGSAQSFMFRWVVELIRGLTPGMCVMFALLVFALFLMVRFLTNDEPDSKKTNLPDYYYVIGSVAIAAMIPVLLYSLDISRILDYLWKDPTFITFYLMTVLMILILVLIVYNIIKGKPNTRFDVCLCVILGFITMVSIGGAFSNVLSIGWSCLEGGLTVGCILYVLSKYNFGKNKSLVKLGVMGIIALMILPAVAEKSIMPYSWWCDTEAPYVENTETTNIEYLQGIYLTPEVRDMYVDFDEKCRMYLSESDDFYCYSNTTLFYKIAHKMPVVSAPVSWPDTCRDIAAINDANYISANHPKLIFFADHGWIAIQTHESLFRDGAECGQRQLYELLLDWRDSPTSPYTVISEYSVNGCQYYLMLRL